MDGGRIYGLTVPVASPADSRHGTQDPVRFRVNKATISPAR
jgi:hypothetical protein